LSCAGKVDCSSLGMEVHEIKDDSGGEISCAISYFHALIYINEFDVCEIGLRNRFVIGYFGIDSSDIIFDGIIWIPSNVLHQHHQENNIHRAKKS